MKWMTFVLLALALVPAGCRGGAAPLPVLFDLNGEAISPLETEAARGHVFLFVGIECPISNRYAPEIQRIAEAYGRRGFRFWLVFPDPSTTACQIRTHLSEYGYALPALRDPDFGLVHYTGASVTPEAAVIDSSGKRVYRGRIDNWYVDFGRARPAPTKRNLEEALQAVLDDRPVSPATTEAVGCYLADLR